MKQRIYTKDVILILASGFSYMSTSMLVIPLIAGFSEDLGASAALMGIIGGLMSLCSLLCRPIVGNLADKISKYRLSFIGAGLMTVACAGYVLAFSPWVVIVSRIINGVGFACCSVCMSTWMSSLLPREKIGSGMGVYGMMNALGMAVAPAIGVSLYQTVGYRCAFLAALVFSAMTAILIQFVGDKGNPVPPMETAAPSGHRLQLVDRKVVPIALIIMLFTIPYYATQSFLVQYVETRQLGVSVSAFFPLYAVILLILRLSLKGFFDKLSFGCFLAASSASAFAGILCLTFMKNNVGLFFAAAFMAGGYGIMCSVCQSTAILLAGEESRGLANSTYYIGLDLGMALGPVIGGFLYGHVDRALFYPFFLITVPAGLLVYRLSRHSSSGAKKNRAVGRHS